MAQKVFAIPELLEQILSHLAPADLFLLQRTSRNWQTPIATSPTLQQKMFLRARSTNLTEIVCLSTVTPNTLLFESLNYYDSEESLTTSTWTSISRKNPDMFITQPPTTCGGALVQVTDPKAPERNFGRRWTIKNEAGIRLRDLIAVVDAITSNDPPEDVLTMVGVGISSVLAEGGSIHAEPKD